MSSEQVKTPRHREQGEQEGVGMFSEDKLKITCYLSIKCQLLAGTEHRESACSKHSHPAQRGVHCRKINTEFSVFTSVLKKMLTCITWSITTLTRNKVMLTEGPYYYYSLKEDEIDGDQNKWFTKGQWQTRIRLSISSRFDTFRVSDKDLFISSPRDYLNIIPWNQTLLSTQSLKNNINIHTFAKSQNPSGTWSSKNSLSLKGSKRQFITMQHFCFLFFFFGIKKYMSQYICHITKEQL